MEWVNKSDTEIRLMDGDDVVATLRKTSYPPFHWTLEFPGMTQYNEFGGAISPAMLQLKATYTMHRMCDTAMNMYKLTKELLPDIGTLEERAGIYDEME